VVGSSGGVDRRQGEGNVVHALARGKGALGKIFPDDDRLLFTASRWGGLKGGGPARIVPGIKMRGGGPGSQPASGDGRQ
jgi:hypothetical protein